MKTDVFNDLHTLLTIFPREFTAEDAVAKSGLDVNRVRQAIVMGMSQDRLMPREIGNSYRIYENVAWRKQWITRRWA